MQQVSAVPPLPPYAVSVADVVAHDVLSAPSPILASAAFWNTFAALSQRVPDPVQLHEFLNRLRVRLTGVSQPLTPVQPRFGGPTAEKMLAGVAAVRRQPGPVSASPSRAQGPHAHLIFQVDLAIQMVAALGG